MAAAAAAHAATFWLGVRPDAPHLSVCLANEAWIRGVIQGGSRVLDIGIDTSRLGSRSPYYDLEKRIFAEFGYPVEPRAWPPSPNTYTPSDPGPCP